MAIFLVLVMFTWHSLWVVSNHYSAPGIVLQARGVDGSKIIYDDFREGYYWLRMNTPIESKVMAWGDYGMN
jgi:dolichyl-diphosphooligosaccharide--protein glycosyltransferase